MAGAASDPSSNPSDSTKNPSDSSNNPSNSSSNPSDSTKTPSGSANAPSGSVETPAISTEYQDRLSRVIKHHDWYYPVYHYKKKEGIYICEIWVKDILFTSDEGKSLAEVKENVARKAYDYWS